MTAPVPPGLNIRFTPAPGSPWRVLADPAPIRHVPITILEAKRTPLCKIWRQHRDGAWPARPAASANEYLFRRLVREVPHGDVEALHTLIEGIARHPRLCLVHGQPINDGMVYVPRRAVPRGNQPATLADQPGWILWLDLDDLAIDGADVIDAPDLAVAAAVAQLGPEFEDTSYIWWFSGGQRPDSATIKLRLGFFLDRPHPLDDLKRWAKSAPVTVDTSLYSPAQIIYTASPQFLDASGAPLPDWLPRRSGYVLGERETVSLAIPEAPAPRPAPTPPADGVPRRDPAVLKPLVASIQRAVSTGAPRHPAIFAAARTAGGYIAGGAVSEQEVLAALLDVAMASGSAGADRAVKDGIEAGRQAPLYAPDPLAGLPEYPRRARTAPSSPEAIRATIRAGLQDLLDCPKTPDGRARIQVYAAPVGVGKTTEGIAVMAERHAQPLWLTPTHALAEQTAANVNARPRTGLLAYNARALRGRLAIDPAPYGEERVTMCLRAEEVAALRAAGAPDSEYTALCWNRRAGDDALTTCPLINQCGYIRQQQHLPPFVAASHNFLLHSSPKVLSTHVEDLVVVDESPRKHLVHSAHWTVGALLAEGSRPEGQLVMRIAQDLASGTPMKAIAAAVLAEAEALVPDDLPPEQRRPAALASITQQLDAWVETLPGDEYAEVYPGQTAADNLSAIARYIARKDPRTRLYALNRALRQVFAQGHVNAIWHVPELTARDGTVHAATIHATWKAQLPKRETPVVVLDATARREYYQAVFGEQIEFIDSTLPAPAVRVVQCHDTTLPMRHLTTRPWQGRLVAFIKSLPGTVGLVTHKRVIDAIKDRLPKGKVVWINFGAVEGLNTLADCDHVVIAGRQEPKAYALESEARALWPAENLRLGQDYVNARGYYRMRDGREVPAKVRMHPDPRVNLLLEMTRDDGLTQTIGRMRTVYGRTDRTLWLLTSVPIDGIEVDDLVSIDDLLPSDRASRLLLAHDGVLPLGTAWLAAHHPEEFPTESAARDWWKREAKKGSFSYKDIFIEKRPLFRTPAYRVAGQRGQATKALVFGALTDDQIAAQLMALHGKPVTLREAAATEDAATIPDSIIRAPAPTTEATPMPEPVPMPTPVPSIRVGNLLGVFPDGFNAALVEPIADTNDDKATWTAAHAAALVAEGWDPRNAAAKAESEWLWLHGAPTVHGLLMTRAAPPTIKTGNLTWRWPDGFDATAVPPITEDEMDGELELAELIADELAALHRAGLRRPDAELDAATRWPWRFACTTNTRKPEIYA